MATNYSTNLGLALPTQGELSGTWGDMVNYGITDYVDIAVAGTLTLNGDGAVNLLQTNGNSSGTQFNSTTAQYAILKITGTTTTKVITAPALSKTYTVINASSYAVTVKASGQTGVTVSAGTQANVAFNGTDYVLVSTNDINKMSGPLTVANGGTGASTLTGLVKGNGTSAFTAAVSGTDYAPPTSGASILYGNGSGGFSNVTIGSGVTFAGGTLSATGTGGTVTSVTASAPLASSGGATPNISFTGTLGVANGGTGASSLTANNVILGNGTSAVQTVAPGSSGNVLTSDGTTWISSPASGAVASGSIYVNNTVISTNYTIATGQNGFSVGPITVSSGYAVTVSSGQRWVVL